ncbi:MAG: crossover junction endodeoxyribonuclease RuvC [Rhodospirillaceae bacterium]|nr:crossover junction endodeoxyribonuclease RuvC [Rhodospirillaceae bacterium]
MRILGLDPGLKHTGWGVIDTAPGRLVHVAHGRVDTDDSASLAQRLATLHAGLEDVLDRFRPAEAAVEETFVNTNPTATLRLGMARGVVLLVPALSGIPVAEYGANHVKKSVVGVGHAGKPQVQAMIAHLLPAAQVSTADAADALAVAICHAHHRETQQRLAAVAHTVPR